MAPSSDFPSAGCQLCLPMEAPQTPEILYSCGLAFHQARVAPSWSTAMLLYFILHFRDPFGNNQPRAKLLCFHSLHPTP